LTNFFVPLKNVTNICYIFIQVERMKSCNLYK
jgi:hypothetical protein